jgi:hypothetical protein
MLKRVLFAAMFGVTCLLTAAPEAECAWCPRIKCLDQNVCGSGCVCLKSGGDTFGSCVSLS